MSGCARAVGRILTILCLWPLATVTPAAKVPLWELGIGPGVMSLPAYRGSSADRTYLLPNERLAWRNRWWSNFFRQSPEQLFL
jgi:hypothetical protein